MNKAYQRLDIYAASVLKQRVYSGEVNFVIPQTLYNVDNQQIKEVSIDVADGKGFSKLKSGSSLQVQYTSEGKKGIAVKFLTDQGEVISYSELEVVTLEVEQPDMTFNLSGPVNGRSLSGGEAQVFMGCDGVFDRPVIIAEGFDPNNTRRIADLQDDYDDDSNVETFLNANGWDVVYLNFANGGADIRTNARVLEQLIDEVNREKVGNRRNVVIGESMGGLVARYCLTDMERRGRTHQVSHFVSFDSPHLGANVPVGFQRMLIDIYAVDIRQLLNLKESFLRSQLNRLQCPASRQMLLRYQGPNPHPDYTALQNELATLGFPRQGGIRNISIINGNENGGRQNPDVGFAPGSQTFEVAFTLYGAVTMRARTWTNQVNNSNKVSSLVIFTGPAPTTIRERSYTFNALNYDIVPGGWENDQGAGDINGWGLNIVNPIEWFDRTFNNFNRGEFSFVPMFSSVAYTGPRNNQNDISRSVANMQTNNWIPFNAVYADNENTPHIRANFIPNEWNDLFRTELGLTISAACQVGTGTGVPPIPTFSGDRYRLCSNQRATFRVINTSAIAGLYRYSWRITGGGVSRSYNGEAIAFAAQAYNPGTYTITLTQRSGGTGSRSSSQTVQVLPSSDNQCSGGGNPPGNPPGGPGPGPVDPVRTAAIQAKPQQEDTTTVVTTVYNIRAWPNPVVGELHVSYQMARAGEVRITLASAIAPQHAETILTTSNRPEGSYDEIYYTDHLAPGLYIVTVRTAQQLIQEKIFIQK